MFSFVLILSTVIVKLTASIGMGWVPWTRSTGLYLWAGNILSAEGIIISLESASLSVFSILKQLGYFFRILLLYHHRRKIFLNLRNLSINSVMPFEQDKDKDKAAFFIET